MNLLSNTNDRIAYLKDVIERVTKEAYDYKSANGSKSNHTSVKLQHMWDTDAQPKFSHKLVYSTTNRINGKTTVDTKEEILEDGTNYNNDAINELIKGTMEATNSEIKAMMGFGTNPSPEDVKNTAQNYFKQALKSVGIHWDINAVIVVVGTNIVQFTVVIG